MNYTAKRYMRICLELAKKGIGRVSPNPLVGCVIVKNNRILGQGYHHRFGTAHAEIVALKAAGSKAKGATMFINLEPCNHWGKTPPCVPQIVKNGIKKVVVAMEDPNPLVNGKGIQQLKVKSVKCRVGILEKEAEELNRFYIKYITQKMPYVILKSAMTLDGKIATISGDSKWISSLPARDYVHRLRGQVDAVLVGKNTVIKDNPSLTAHRKGRNPLRVIIVPDLDIPLNRKIFNSSAPTLIITKENALPAKIRILEKKGIRFLRTDSKIDFRQIMRELAKMNIASVLIEGGGETNASALKDNIVDEIQFFLAPKIIGGRSAKTPVEGEGIKTLSQTLRIKDWAFEKIGVDLLIKGKVVSN